MKNLKYSFIIFVLALFGCTESPIPGLTSADLNNIAPCPNQELLTDPSLLDAFKAARIFTVCYNQTAQNQDQLCNRNDGFTIAATEAGNAGDYTINLNGAPVSALTPITLTMDSLVTSAFGGHCGDSNSGVRSFGVGGAELPKAGTYRVDVRFTGNARTFLVRVRIMISAGSPDYTGDSLHSLGITNLTSDVTYFIGDTQITPDVSSQALLADAKPTDELVMKRASDGAVLLRAKVQVICVEEKTVSSGAEQDAN